MCTSLKGKLKSRFLVLSDDRNPPPPPVNKGRGKRGHEDHDEDQTSKRNRPVRPQSFKPTPGVSGVYKINPESTASSVPSSESLGAVPRRSTPSRAAKRTPILSNEVAMEVVSLESNSTSTEDWASSRSHDDTIE